MKPKPSTGFEIEGIPDAMRAAVRWMNWKAVERDGKWTKVPVDPNTGRSGDSTDSSKWGSNGVAVHRATADHTLGLGFALGDGWVGVDLDGIVDEASGKIIDDDVWKWIDSHETYIETTPSGTGLHAIFFNVAKPEWSQNKRGFVEVYADKRFFTVTGHARFRAREIVADQHAIDSLCDKWLRKDAPSKKPIGDASGRDFAFVCDLKKAGTPKLDAGAKLEQKMIAEGRGEKAARPDYIGRTVDKAYAASDESRARSSRADEIVELAHERYRLGQTSKAEGFAVAKTGANVAHRLRGSKIKATLAHAYYAEHKRVAGATASGDALDVLEGEAMQATAEELSLRVGRDGDTIVLDLCRVDGQAVVVNCDGWRRVDRSPILFERSELTGELPIPEAGGEIDELRALLNVDDDNFAVLIGWLLAALVPDIAHPILMLGGGQGTGKTTTARYLCGLFDASGAPVRSQPRDPEGWALTLASCYSTVVDNVSIIPDWWSDSLCKAVTGDGIVRRQLYSDRELCVMSFRRVVVLTSIDAGALRGDLGERLVLVDLEKIEAKNRRGEAELDAAYKAAAPRVLGALLSLLSRVLSRWTHVQLAELPRMADFARILAALDEELGTNAQRTYASQSQRIAEDVIDADLVGTAIVEFMAAHESWSGTMKELLDEIKPQTPERRFPSSPRSLGAQLRRLTPALDAKGIRVTAPAPTNKKRTWILDSARTAQPPEGRTWDTKDADDPWAIDPQGTDRPRDSPRKNRAELHENCDLGRLGDSGGLLQSMSLASECEDLQTRGET